MDIKKISALARITLNKNEQEQLKEDITRVLEAFSVLDDWQIKHYENKNTSASALREDVTHKSLSQEQVLKNVTYSEEGFLVGPKTTQ